MARPHSKFAVLSPVVPPYSSGQAVMLYRFLENIPAENYVLLSCFRPEILAGTSKATKELPGKTIHLRSFSHPEKMLSSKLALITEPFRYAADILSRARQLRQIIAEEHINGLIACSGDFADMAASYLAAKRSKIKLVPHMFDYFSYQQTGIFRRVAKTLEQKVLKIAFTSIVPNEFMGRELTKTYGADSVILRNPCVIPPLPTVEKKGDEFVILYTGAVYNAQSDAMARLVLALEQIANPKVKLHIYTTQEPEALADFGIKGTYVELHSHLPQEEIPKVQAAADLLFLPLSFESTYDVLIRTSAPGKMGEYMAIAKPILAHVPPNSFPEWYINQHECGKVVTSTNVDDLVAAITSFLEHPEQGIEMGKNGRKAAEADYALPVVQKKYFEFSETLRD